MVACFPRLLWPYPVLQELIQAWHYRSLIISCLILSGAVGVAAVFCSLNRCGAARGFPSSLQHSLSQAFHTCLSSAGPLFDKSERGISSAKHLLNILQCPPKIKLQSRASVNPTCLISSCSFFLIPSLTPKQTFFSSEALGSTDHLVVKLLLNFTDTHFPEMPLYLHCAEVPSHAHADPEGFQVLSLPPSLLFASSFYSWDSSGTPEVLPGLLLSKVRLAGLWSAF